jgi:hypothetical protein
MMFIESASSSPDLAELGKLLASSRIRPGCFSLSELDGFLAAIVVGPVWMSTVLGEEGPGERASPRCRQSLNRWVVSSV